MNSETEFIIGPRIAGLPHFPLPPLISFRGYALIRNILTGTLATVLSFTAMGAHAQTQQQIAFIGDGITEGWSQQPSFTAHASWQSYATAPQLDDGVGAVEAQLQTIISSGKKPIIHLMLGTGSYLESPGDPHSAIFSGWAGGFEQIITTAQEAKLKIIVGTVPFSGPPDDESDVNKWIQIYCAAHHVPVVNYDFALNSGTGSSASLATGVLVNPGSGQPVPQAPVYYSGEAPYSVPTSQAYALMSDMAQTAIIQAEGYKLKGGYLNTVVYDGNSVTDDEDYPVANANTVWDGGYVQFTPYGQYTDGSTHIINNADIDGHIGRWTNSNPAALYLDQNGAGRAMDAGTTNVHFTTLSGETINEWVMYTVIYDLCGCTSF